MLFLNRHDVETLLDLDRLIEALGPAMVELSAGRVSMPARVAAQVREHGGLLAAMPAFLGSAQVLSTKLVSVFPKSVGVAVQDAVAAQLVLEAAVQQGVGIEIRV